MEGCSLHDAFPDAGDPRSAGRVARREEKRRATSCPGPALAFLKAQKADLDPDRQTQTKLPPAEKLGAGAGFRETDGFHDGGEGDLAAQKVNDVIGQVKAKTATQAPDYFGKPPVDAYANFSPSPKDNPGYLLGAGQADFLGSFAAPGLGKAGGEATLATPMTNNAWKPMSSPAWTGGVIGAKGANTSFVNSEDHTTMVKKLDILFARLEDLESRENANGHIEVTMFILSGLFLLFGIETLRKF
jgi:hypothetical protein